MTPHPKSKMLIIDTTQYAGNFERPMCAYITGQIGDCGVGSDIAEEASKDIKYLDWWTKHIAQETDDSGCARPASIWSTPGWFNNGLGNHYLDIPENEPIAVAAAIKLQTQYQQVSLNAALERIAQRNFETTPNGWTQKACENVIEQCALNLQKSSILNKYPAYMSVAIFVDEFPPEDVWAEFMARAQFFVLNRDKIMTKIWDQSKIDITGFRKIEPQYTLNTTKTIEIG